MVSARHGLKKLTLAIGVSFGVVLLGALVRTGTASAQCSALGPAGAHNTACGDGALTNNATGHDNSAFGFNTLNTNTKGSANTAVGSDALFNNTVAPGELSGTGNTATGFQALFNNTVGGSNTASGISALFKNTTGSDNSASGDEALFSNTTGGDNTASGVQALVANTTGTKNTASGGFALSHDTTGSSNIGLGLNAGSNIVAGNNNIEIGGAGPSDESNTIRIGTNGMQKKTYIAGISGIPVTDNLDVVVVNTAGQLGILSSSARYKRDIRDMGGASADLMKLRPVSFRYKSDPSGTLQYGLVAEQVARVYPELVTRGTDGKVQSVRYWEFTAMLLNELQKQATKLAGQQREIEALKQQNASINTMSERLAALERQARTAHPELVGSLAAAK
jgi:hypothetical protein